MKDLNYQLSKLCRDNRDGGFSTQATRSRDIGADCKSAARAGLSAHAAPITEAEACRCPGRPMAEPGISVGTLKNRLSALRWWAMKVNKPSIIAKDNDVYGIGKREYVAKESKAQDLDDKKLSEISDPFVRLSVRLQAAFGLRREESIKFNPSFAMQGDRIRLKSSWTKGGRARTVPIRNDEQRQLLEDVKDLAKARLLDPGTIELRPAIASLRATASQRRHVKTSWPPTCLCPATLS